MQKKVVAVSPHVSSNGLQHEWSAFKAWSKLGGSCIYHQRPWRIFHHFLYKYQLPHLTERRNEARLLFLSGYKLLFQSFPDYLNYEIIPLFWDCWPECQARVKSFLRKNRVKTAIFTSSQVAKQIQIEFPHIQILTITEGIDTSLYDAGKTLIEREIDLIEYGRRVNMIGTIKLPNNRQHLYSKQGEWLFANNTDFYRALANSKITMAFPRSVTHPEIAGNIETLTQRYWENMLSRVLMVGQAPQELVDLIGYNPVLAIDEQKPSEQINDILAKIAFYQDFVDKNREIALKYAPWENRIVQIQKFLKLNTYIL